MNDLTDKKIRFSNAAIAIGTSPKALRNWFQRYDFKLVTDSQGREWTNFNLADIAILAITRELNKWGCTIEQANALAFGEVVERRGRGVLLMYKNTPAAALIATLATEPMVLSQASNGEWKSISKDQFLTDECPAHLLIHLDKVVQVAFNLLSEGLDA